VLHHLFGRDSIAAEMQADQELHVCSSSQLVACARFVTDFRLFLTSKQ